MSKRKRASEHRKRTSFVSAGWMSLRKLPLILVFLLSLCIYIRTLCPTVFVEGTGENIVCVWTLSVPHPPGFPLFCLLGKLFTLLVPVGDAAYRINLFAAVMGAATVSALYCLMRVLGIGIFSSAAAALSFAYSATFWRQSTIAEVYTLSLFLIVIQISLLVCRRRGLSGTVVGNLNHTNGGPDTISGGDRYLLWTAFVFGLGLAVHYMHVFLVIPYGVFVLVTDRAVFKRVGLLLKAVGVSLLGFGLHLYAPIRSLANPPIDWGNPETMSNWLRYLTAAQYRGRMFHLPAEKVMHNLYQFLNHLPQEFWFPGLAAAVLGFVVCCRKDKGLFVLSSIIAILFVIWAINYDIPWEIEVYYLPVFLVVAVWIGFGTDWLVSLSPNKLVRLIIGVFVLTVPLSALGLNFSNNDLSRESFVRHCAEDVIDVAEPDSAILLPPTNPTFALMVLKETSGVHFNHELFSLSRAAVVPVERGVLPVQTGKIGYRLC